MMQMNHNKSIPRNLVFNFIKTFSGLVFPVVTFTYAARILGDAGIGRVNFAKSIITYFSMLAMLGMNSYGTREAAKLRNDKEKLSKFVCEMLLINGCTTLIAYILLFVSICIVPKFSGYECLLWVCSFAILMQGMGMEWLYQALEEYQYIAVRSVVFQLIALVGLFVFVRQKDDVIAYAAVTVFASSGSYILNFVNARKFVAFRKLQGFHIREHLQPLLWLFAVAVSIELYTVLDSTMLGFIRGDASVGIYTAAVKVNKMVNTLIGVLGIVLIPRLSYYIGSGEYERENTLVCKAYNFVFLLSVPSSVGLFLLSDEIILLFSGKGFVSAGFTMRLLTPIVLLIPFSFTTNQHILVPMGKEKRILISTAVGALSNLFCNALLIPHFGENGAAVATVIAEAMVALVCFLNIRCYVNIRQIFSVYWQYWVAIIPTFLCAWLFQLIPIHRLVRMFILIILSAGSYFTVLYFLKNPFFSEALSILGKKIGRKS